MCVEVDLSSQGTLSKELMHFSKMKHSKTDEVFEVWWGSNVSEFDMTSIVRLKRHYSWNICLWLQSALHHIVHG